VGPTVNRQDIQNMFNTCQNRILERAATKQDVQALSDTIKSLLNVSQQNQQFMRQADYQRTQLVRRTMALETRIAQLEQAIAGYRDVLNRLANMPLPQPQRIIMPTPQHEHSTSSEQYVYRPA
jgi:Mg2+ and Co2+ transporter CorA